MLLNPANVLLAEDNPAHAQLVLRRLSRHEIKASVTHVSDGEAALDYLFHRGSFTDPEQAPRPDVVLLDLRMPRIDGFEVLQAVKSSEQLASIPIVVLTTSSARSDIEKAYRFRANSYLVKPIDFQDFSDMMNGLGFYWMGWNRVPYDSHPQITV